MNRYKSNRQGWVGEAFAAIVVIGLALMIFMMEVGFGVRLFLMASGLGR